MLLLITLYLFVINKCCSEAHEAHVEFVWWGGGGGCGLQNHFHVQPNYSVVVVLCCDVVGVVTIMGINIEFQQATNISICISISE